MSDKDEPLEKGKALDISGLPLPGQAFTQFDNPGAEPNRNEPQNAFKEEEDRDESYMHDYTRDEKERLGPLMEGYVANKDDEQWSAGLQDEQNELDDKSKEGLYPEIQPLHIDVLSKVAANEDDPDFVLKPDTVDYVNEEPAEAAEFIDETGDAS